VSKVHVDENVELCKISGRLKDMSNSVGGFLKNVVGDNPLAEMIVKPIVRDAVVGLVSKKLAELINENLKKE